MIFLGLIIFFFITMSRHFSNSLNERVYYCEVLEYLICNTYSIDAASWSEILTAPIDDSYIYHPIRYIVEKMIACGYYRPNDLDDVCTIFDVMIRRFLKNEIERRLISLPSAQIYAFKYIQAMPKDDINSILHCISYFEYLRHALP
jgi:hypothetical protein